MNHCLFLNVSIQVDWRPGQGVLAQCHMGLAPAENTNTVNNLQIVEGLEDYLNFGTKWELRVSPLRLNTIYPKRQFILYFCLQILFMFSSWYDYWDCSSDKKIQILNPLKWCNHFDKSHQKNSNATLTLDSGLRTVGAGGWRDMADDNEPDQNFTSWRRRCPPPKTRCRSGCEGRPPPGRWRRHPARCSLWCSPAVIQWTEGLVERKTQT